jgi:hypothetical protein
VAQKLHSQYGYSYDNLKVLLGGWNTWNQEHAKDPAKYPEGGTSATPGADTAPSGGAPAVTVVPQP